MFIVLNLPENGGIDRRHQHEGPCGVIGVQLRASIRGGRINCIADRQLTATEDDEKDQRHDQQQARRLTIVRVAESPMGQSILLRLHDGRHIN
jgi:hypothetical protein